MAQPQQSDNIHRRRKMAELNAWTKQRHEVPLEPDLPILDPHHHLWDDERGRYLIHELLEDIATGHVETCIEVFGPDLCMIEGNFPSEKKACGYGVFCNAMKRVTQRCSTAEKEKLYRDTAARVYRLTHLRNAR